MSSRGASLGDISLIFGIAEHRNASARQQLAVHPFPEIHDAGKRVTGLDVLPPALAQPTSLI